MTHAQHQEPVQVQDDEAPNQAADDGHRQRRAYAVVQREHHREGADAGRCQQHDGHLDEPCALVPRCLGEDLQIRAAQPREKVAGSIVVFHQLSSSPSAKAFRWASRCDMANSRAWLVSCSAISRVGPATSSPRSGN